jgi:ribonuclease Z
MKLQFIGTGSGKTSLKRNHSSILITSGNHNLLIDAGDGTSKALLSQNIKYDSIDSILFTHYHADHFGGIASLITQMKLVERKNLLTIFTHNKLIEPLKNFLNYSYLFDEKLGFDFKIIGFNEEEKIIITNEIYFTARKNSHIKQTEILKNYNHISFISCSFYLSVANKRIIYTSDIGSAEDLYLFADKNADYFITETTHVTFEEIYKSFKTQDPGRLFLTHIEDGDEFKISQFISKLNPTDKEKISIAFDNLTLTD